MSNTAAEAALARLADGVAGLRVLVNGLGISGPPVARLLAARGARVTAVDGRDDDANRQVAGELAGLGITVELDPAPKLPAGTDLVITTPGRRPSTPPLTDAAAAGIPVIGDVELARAARPRRPAWLGGSGATGQ